MSGRPSAHVQAAVALVVAGTHTVTAAAALHRCGRRAIQISLRRAGFPALPPGRPRAVRGP